MTTTDPHAVLQKSGTWRSIHADELTSKHFEPDSPKAIARTRGKNRSLSSPDSSLAVSEEPELKENPLADSPVADSEPAEIHPSEPAELPKLTEEELRDPQAILQRRQHLEHHIRSNPTDLGSFMELARIYRSEQKPIEAKRVLEQANEIFPDDRELLWELEEATLARSLQQLREVTDLATRLDTAETDRELQRCQLDWANRRIEICRQRLKRDPSLLHLRIALGEALHDANQYEAAIEELEPALSHDELSPAAHLLRGKCLLALKKELEAMAELRSCSMRRSVVAPIRTRVLALRLLCETSDRLGIKLSSLRYHEQLRHAEQELAKQPAPTH